MNDNFWAFLNKSKNIFWKGYSGKNRNVCIYEIEDIINRYGSIIDYKMFSDLEICFRIEIAEQNIHKLYEGLIEQIEMGDYEDFEIDSKTERTILLNVTFLQGMGNMKIEGPIGPG